MTRLDPQRQPPLEPERVAYWYFRLNGFLQIENFIVHPGGKGSQRTDADLLGVRFPYRNEFLFDHDKPMQDAAGLGLSPERIDVVIAEIKANQPCSLNGPWTKEDRQNVHRVLAAIGCLQEQEIPAAASAIYKMGTFVADHIRIRLLAVGRNTDDELADRYKHVTQLTWREMLGFIWRRFDDYRIQKSDVQQWNRVGRRLQSMATSSREPEPFVRLALSAMGIIDEQ